MQGFRKFFQQAEYCSPLYRHSEPRPLKLEALGRRPPKIRHLPKKDAFLDAEFHADYKFAIKFGLAKCHRKVMSAWNWGRAIPLWRTRRLNAFVRTVLKTCQQLWYFVAKKAMHQSCLVKWGTGHWSTDLSMLQEQYTYLYLLMSSREHCAEWIRNQSLPRQLLCPVQEPESPINRENVDLLITNTSNTQHIQ